MILSRRTILLGSAAALAAASLPASLPAVAAAPLGKTFIVGLADQSDRHTVMLGHIQGDTFHSLIEIRPGPQYNDNIVADRPELREFFLDYMQANGDAWPTKITLVGFANAFCGVHPNIHWSTQFDDTAFTTRRLGTLKRA